MLLLAGWWWSLLAFRRYVIDFLSAQSRDFESDLERSLKLDLNEWRERAAGDRWRQDFAKLLSPLL